MKIGYSYPDSENPFWRLVAEGFKEEAGRRNVNIVLKAAGNDEDQQIADLGVFPEKGADIVCVSPINTAKAVKTISGLSAGGVRFIAVDQYMGQVPEATILSNNHIGGLKLGGLVARSLPPGSKLLHLSAGEGVDNARIRREAFIESLQANSPSVRILETLNARSDRQVAYRQVLAFLKEDGPVDGVFAENDAMALGAIQAFRMQNLPLPLVVGYDGIDEALELIRNGEMLATVEQFPFEIGTTSLAAACALANGGESMKSKFVQVKLITREDL